MQFLFSSSEFGQLRKKLMELNTAGDSCSRTDGPRFARSPLIDTLSVLMSCPKKARAEKDLDFLASKGKIGGANRCSDAIRAIQMVERTRLLYSSLGFKEFHAEHMRLSKADVLSYAKNIAFWERLYGEGKAEAFAKHQSVSMFNIIHDQESLPKAETYGWGLGVLPCTRRQKQFLKLLKKRMIDGTYNIKRVYQQSQAFLYFKKGCPVSSDSFIEDSLKKHRTAMEKIPPATLVDDTKVTFSPKIVDRTWVPSRSTEKALKSRVREIVRKVFKFYKHPSEWWTPSANASFDSNREKGGQLSEITTSDLGDTTGFQWVEKVGPMTEYIYSPWCCCPTQDIIGCSGGCYQAQLVEYIRVPIDCNIGLRLSARIDARPVALPEPLKVRVITAESSWSSYCLKGAQEALWQCLHRFKWFRLTGRPCVERDIPPLSEEEIREGLKWISIDYKAATDNLSRTYSAYVIEQISQVCDLPYDLCLESLCQHLIWYDKKTIEVEQQNGQLMGSILSFIVLCVCNSAILSLTIDPHTVNFNRDILVNGDDGLMKGTSDDYNRWKQLSTEVGLEPSVGKTYVSEKFCVINSQLYYRSEGKVVVSPYANAIGITAYDAKRANAIKSPLDLAESHRMWMRGFSHFSMDDQWEAERLWYSSCSWLLKDPQVNHISWYMDRSLGGLGLSLPLNGTKDNIKVSPYQQFRAREAILALKKKGVVRPYVSLDYQCLDADLQVEALNHLFGGEKLCDTFRIALPSVPEGTLRAMKVMGLSGECGVKVTDDKERKYLSCLGKNSLPEGFIEECFVTRKQPLVLKREKDSLKDPNSFFYHRKMTRNFGANRELLVKDVNKVRIALIESQFRLKISIPQDKRFPWMLPYRSFLEGIQEDRRRLFI